MNNARKIDEIFSTYHQRLEEEQKALDAKLSGTLIWSSPQKGTFTKNQKKVVAPTALAALQTALTEPSLSSEPHGQTA